MQNTTEKQARNNVINFLNSLVTGNSLEIGWQIEAAKLLLIYADNKPTLDVGNLTATGAKQLLEAKLQSGGNTLDD